ncbi:hypothetical protein BZL30_4655 [Mycobacterium kansasii]|uniref:Uncharacterized protein n=1 Tax=Mycobacterium kansasii TaxID=1768 RepID=A0A1V3X561_MYCKA|nr:hypothetical protein BZL30_4655 [Mycobacterium kansasii]
MARPKKREDPQRWPIRCARCDGHYELVASWPDGSICGYCYQAAKRTIGICACGHEGVLPGLIDDRPACRRCSGVKLNVDCVTCGAEAELYSGGRCQRCVLGATAQRLLTDPDTGLIAPQLQVLVDALTAMHRPNSGLTWIRKPHVQSVLRELAGHPPSPMRCLTSCRQAARLTTCATCSSSTVSFRHVTRDWRGSNHGRSRLSSG